MKALNKPKGGSLVDVLAGPWNSQGESQAELPDGWTLRLLDCAPGEQVRARIDHISKGGKICWGSVQELLSADPDRRDPPCAVHGRCGACGLQHLREDAQLRHKVEAGASSLPAALADRLVPQHAWIRSEALFSYRHKSVLLPNRRKGRLELGGYARRSHRVIDLESCPVLAPALRTVHSELRQRIGTIDGPPLALWPPGTEAALPRSPALRSIVLRANRRGQVLATFACTSPGLGDRLIRPLRQLVDGDSPLIGAFHQLHDEPGDAVSGRQPPRLLCGAKSLTETVSRVHLELGPLDFFQVNPAVLEGMCERLNQWLRADAPVGQRLLDLYCGGGVLGLALALKGPALQLTGIERKGDVLTAARSKSHKLKLNALYVEGTPAELLPKLRRKRGPFSAAIVNPPRSGARPADLAALLDCAPRQIAWVSCHTPALARDASLLMAAGYEARALAPADMMPQTPHVEWLALFERVSPE